MEETFLRVKSERDELIKRNNRDATDGGKSMTANEEIANLRTELKRQKAQYEAQFIEYVSAGRFLEFIHELRRLSCYNIHGWRTLLVVMELLT